MILLLVVVLGVNLVTLSVTKLVTSSPADLVCHTVPVPIKLRSILLIHLPEDVVFLSIVSLALFNDFATLSVKHPLVSHFLVTCRLVVVHLVPLCDFLSVWTVSPFSLRLVNLANRLTVRPHPRLVGVGLNLELTVAALAHTSVHHVLAHVLHHVVHATKANHAHAPLSVKEWIIFEGVHHHAPSPEALKHLVGHLTHLLVHVVGPCKHLLRLVTKGH